MEEIVAREVAVFFLETSANLKKTRLILTYLGNKGKIFEGIITDKWV